MVDLIDPARNKSTRALGSLHATCNKSGFLQHSKVPGDRWLAHFEWLRQIHHRCSNQVWSKGFKTSFTDLVIRPSGDVKRLEHDPAVLEDIDIFLDLSAFEPALGKNAINRELKKLGDAVGLTMCSPSW